MYKPFFWYIEMLDNSSAGYYLRKNTSKKPRERHQNLSEEGKNNKWEYGCKRYKNLTADEKRTLAEYKTE